MVDSEQTQTEAPGKNEENNDNSLTELEGKIICQVEYYFGDFNLVKDKFLQEQVKEDDGWVTLETLLKFNRLASLSKDSNEIVSALEKSKTGLLEIHESKEKIRRSPNMPLPEMNEERRKELMERTVYCKGFPIDRKLNEILEFFYNYGDIENVAMRNWHDKAANEWKFKGSVFVIFKSISGAENFLKVESIKYNDKELIRKWQKDYIEDKRKERLDRLKSNKKGKGQDKKKGNNNKGAGDADNEEKQGSSSENEENEGFPSGTVVELTGLVPTIKWEKIKDKIEEMGISVAFIEYNVGNEVAFVRLTEKDTARELEKLVSENDNKLKIGENDLKLRVVEGEEEAKYLEKQMEEFMKRRNAANKRKFGSKMDNRRKRGRNYGKWSENKKRRGDSPAKSDQPPVKQKTEDKSKDD